MAGLAFLLATACSSPILTAPPEPSPTLFSPTATFAFPTSPPTVPPTPAPSPSPTTDRFEGVGGVIFADAFSENQGWDLGSDSIGATSIQAERLVLTLRLPHALRFAIIPHLLPQDYYLEVDIRSELCKSGDEFGLMFRLNSNLENYRLSVRCEGAVLVSRILEGESRVLVPAFETFALRPGPLSNNQIALSLVGDTFRVWINSIEILSVRDPLLKQGEMALFARSGDSTLVTTSFDNLMIRKSEPAQPTETNPAATATRSQ